MTRKAHLTPADLYRTAGTSAWRLEALQHYEVPGDEDRQRAFHAGGPLPPPRAAKQDDLRLIAGLVQSGRQVGRIHVVDQPPSPYVRYELAVYAENAAAGEDVRIADRSQHPELAACTQDFAIADPAGEHPGVVLFNHNEDGRVIGYRVDCSRGTVAACREQFALALSLSVPLSEFMAASLSP